MTEQLQLPQALIDLQAEATKRPDFLSQTSRQLHADLYTYLEHQRHEGSEVIEVGCNHGGFFNRAGVRLQATADAFLYH